MFKNRTKASFSLAPLIPLGSWIPRAPQRLSANRINTLRFARPQSQWILKGSRWIVGAPLQNRRSRMEAGKNLFIDFTEFLVIFL